MLGASTMNKPTTTTRRTFARIRRYLRGDGLTMAFQPIANLDTGKVLGFESLARFDGQPLRSPQAWFQDAATAGLRGELEVAAARAAIRSLSDIPDGTFLTINASPDVAMSPAFIETVSEAGSRIVVEITEHAPIESYDALNAALKKLRARGVRVAIDDAGAGFANMTHMLQIEADLIKLDVELTRHIDIDARRKAMVASLVDFARTVGATLVAEGIETEAELEALKRLGVLVGQGYHLGRPAPIAPTGTGAEACTRNRFWRSTSNGLADAASFMFRRGTKGRRTGFALRVALVLSGALLVGPATLAVAEDATPGSPAYWVKRRVEDVRLLVALDRDGELRLHMQFARRRLNELNRVLVDGNSEAATMVLADYRRHVETVGRTMPGDETVSESVNRWVGHELSDYLAALERESTEECAASARRKARSACAPIEQAAKRSRATLEKVKKPAGPPAAPAPKVNEPSPPAHAKSKKN